jgi:hypothetical protein
VTSQQLGRQAARRSVLDAQAVLRKQRPRGHCGGRHRRAPLESERQQPADCVGEGDGGWEPQTRPAAQDVLTPSVRDAESIRQDRVSEWWAIPARTQIKFRSDAAKWRGDMDDMVAFITGGGSGIGQAAAKLLARRGARVSLAGRTQDHLAEVAEAIYFTYKD